MEHSPYKSLILVVDDDSSNRDLMTLRLKYAGFQRIMAAKSGRQALEIISEQMPDLILLDVMMPGMSGIELTARIREQYPDQFIPIMLISALQSAQDRTAGIEAGANDFLSRPLDLDELLARISSLLVLKQTRDELEAERRRLALLYNVSRTLTSKLDYTALMQEIVALITTLTGATKTLLLVLDADGSFKEKAIARYDAAPRVVNEIDERVFREGLPGWILTHRESVRIDDVAQDERWINLPDEEEEAQAVVGAPLIGSEGPVGVLLLISEERSAFQQEHVDLLMAIAAQAAIALENARLYEEMRRQRSRVETLLNSTGDPVLATDPHGVITRINPAAERLLNLDKGIALGQSLEALFSLQLADLLLRARERKSSISGEYTLRSAEHHRTFNVSVSPVEDSGFVLVWQDITPLKESEQIRLANERAETERVRNVFSRYMSPTLVERVLNDPYILDRQERREALVLFADLRGFTRLTIEHGPDDVMALLNDIFTEMMEIVYEHEGVIFDIAGDELMIGFNVPYDQPDARERALRTAIAMQRRFVELRRAWRAKDMIVGMGIGINLGQVVLGHVGGRARMNYAMVGEAVNIAHRLVDLADDGQIFIVPELMNDSLKEIEDFVVREIPPIRVKGKDKPQRIIMLERLPNASL